MDNKLKSAEIAFSTDAKAALTSIFKGDEKDRDFNLRFWAAHQSALLCLNNAQNNFLEINKYLRGWLGV